MPTNTQKIAYNAVISSAARAMGIILAVIIVGLSTRYLGDNGFGQYVIILAYLYIFSVLADLGLYSIVVRDISKKGADEKKIASAAFSIRMSVGVLVFIVASVFIWFLPYDNAVKRGIPFAAIGFWALSNTQVLIGIFQKYLRMDLVSLAELFGRAVQLILVWLTITYKLGFEGILAALVAGSVITFFLTFIFAKKFVRIGLDFDFSYWRKIIKESYPLAISAVLVMVYFKADTMILSFIKPLEDVGIYGVAYKIMENLIFFPAMFTGLMVPQMAKSFKADAVRFFRIIQKSFNFLILLSVLIVAGTLILSPKIVALIAGKGFDDSAMVLNILAFALFFIFQGALFSNIIIVIGKQKILYKIYLAGAVVNVAVNLALIPLYSYYAAAFTTLLTEAIVTLAMIWVTYKEIKYFPSLDRLFKAIISAAIMALFIYKISYLNIIFLVVLSPLVYFAILLLVKGITKEEAYGFIKRKI